MHRGQTFLGIIRKNYPGIRRRDRKKRGKREERGVKQQTRKEGGRGYAVRVGKKATRPKGQKIATKGRQGEVKGKAPSLH